MKNAENIQLYKELDEHKIAKVSLKKIRSRFPRLYGKNAALPEHSYGYTFSVYEITTDKGATGWGIPGDWEWNMKDENQKEKPDIRTVFLNRRVSDLFDPRTGILIDEAIGLDFTIHDLAGNILGMPVYRMLGDSVQYGMDCYDGAIYMNDISPDSRPGGVEAIINDCWQDYDFGYRDFKIKIGRGLKWMDHEEGLKRDIEVTQLVRKNFPDSRILVDGNDAFTVDEIIRYLDAVYECEIYWLEEPFKEDRENLLKLKDYLMKKSPGILVADGECYADMDQILSLADEGLIDVLCMDITQYGFTNWRKFLPVTAEKNYKVSPRNWGQKIKTHYTAHLAKTCQNAVMIEGVPDLTEGVDFEGYTMIDGKIHVPEKPGFGMDLIWGQESA